LARAKAARSGGTYPWRREEALTNAGTQMHRSG
jgi:hypothetical protein